MAEQSPGQRYVLCLTDRGDQVSVIKGKLYRLAEPDPNDPPDDIRIIDEEGEDYPYPRDWFFAIDLPQQVIEILEAA